jgi:hypothetical protein
MSVGSLCLAIVPLKMGANQKNYLNSLILYTLCPASTNSLSNKFNWKLFNAFFCKDPQLLQKQLLECLKHDTKQLQNE